MKRMVPSLGLAAAFAVGLSAQTPTQTPTPTPQNPTPSSQSAMAGQKNTVTLTGCLKAGDQPNTYVLTNIKSDAAKAPAGTAGTAGMASMPDLKGEDVRLTGAPAGVDLSKHVGHTVSVSGMLAPQSGMSPRGTTGTPSTRTPSTTPPSTTQPSTPPSTTEPATRPSTGMDKPGHSLNVRSVSMVSADCSM